MSNPKSCLSQQEITWQSSQLIGSLLTVFNVTQSQLLPYIGSCLGTTILSWHHCTVKIFFIPQVRLCICKSEIQPIMTVQARHPIHSDGRNLIRWTLECWVTASHRRVRIIRIRGLILKWSWILCEFSAITISHHISSYAFSEPMKENALHETRLSLN